MLPGLDATPLRKDWLKLFVRAMSNGGAAIARTAMGATSLGTSLFTAATASDALAVLPIQSKATVATTSGTTIDFTGIPSWAKRITVNLNGVSLSGTDNLMLQLGDSGGIETTGYASTNASITNAASPTVAERTDGFALQSNSATGLFTGSVTLTLVDPGTNTWVASGVVARGNGGVNVFAIAGSKATSATLDRVRLTVSGTNTFDAGAANVLYE